MAKFESEALLALELGQQLEMTFEHIHTDDPRYDAWKKVYNLLLDESPAELRTVLRPSAGTLASKIVSSLLPKTLPVGEQS